MTVVEQPHVRTGAVGTSAPRQDAADKLRGLAQFAGDIVVPRMLHGKVLRSTLPHARIVAVDTSEAQTMPGVVCTLTARDLDDIDQFWGHAIRDRPVLAVDKVRFAGEPVAAVAAEDEATAIAALERIHVEYEELQVVGTVDEALTPDAPLVHDGPIRPGLFHGLGELPPREGNVCFRFRLDRGEVEAVFAHADLVVEGEYRFPAVYQYAMETHTVVAQVEGDEITLWASCQHPFLVRAEIAQLFGVPLSDVRVVVPYLGGGFGSKSYTKMEPITVALARKAGRPVRVQNRVAESMVTTRRHGMRCRMRTAATNEGRLLARDVEIWFDTGAYADNGPRVTATGADAAPGPYRWEAYRVNAACVYTNTAPAGSYRAFGAAHLQWIGELQVDEIAHRVGLDPLDVRRANLCTPGEELRAGGKPLDADLVGDVEKAAAAVGWDDPKPPNVGRGVSVGLLAAGAHPVSTAVLRLEADGKAVVLVGTTEVGQGARTVFAQIAAEELRLPVEHVTVRGADTRFTPYDRSTGASRSTTIAGLAVKRAAEQVRAQLVELAGSDDVGAGDYPGLFERHFGLAGGELIGRGEVAPEGSGSYAEGPVFWEVCVGAAEVEVDPDTGRVRVRKTATIADVGKAINPLLVHRQDEGGTMQGLGNALFEEMVYEDGLLLGETLLDYRIPTVHDLPDDMRCIVVENEDGPGPYGAKGCGEGSLAATTAAIATALADAGVPMTELPLTPERVWRRMRTREGGHMTEVRRAAVIGTGTMGPGMGAVLARAGIETALYDVSGEALERAKGGVTMAEGVLDRLEAPKVEGGSLRFESDLAAALDGADFVLEAVPEKLELKHEVFTEFEQHVADDAVLASNTSGIPITKIAAVCEHPGRVVGMHWSNPPNLIPMIEVIPGEQTDQEVVDATCDLIRRINYHPVVEKEVPGFVENRILYAILRECLDLVDRGIIDPEGLDLNVRWGIGYKLAVIGPMELLDMAGLDIYDAVGSYLNQDLSTSGEVSSTIREKIAEGKLGMKAGSGIYDYTPEDIDRLRAERAAKLVAVRKALEG